MFHLPRDYFSPSCPACLRDIGSNFPHNFRFFRLAVLFFTSTWKRVLLNLTLTKTTISLFVGKDRQKVRDREFSVLGHCNYPCLGNPLAAAVSVSYGCGARPQGVGGCKAVECS